MPGGVKFGTWQCDDNCSANVDDHGFCLTHNAKNAQAAAHWRSMTAAQQKRFVLRCKS